ncbi:hypothetical protein ACROYT_G019039 [Oculina patagonica]
MSFLQFGKYRVKSFFWLLQNDVGWAVKLMAEHEKARLKARRTLDPQWDNKEALNSQTRLVNHLAKQGIKEPGDREFALHCRRTTRSTEEITENINNLIEFFDSPQERDTLGVPLFNHKRIWEEWEEAREHVSCITDPPGVQLYTEVGTKGAWCACGSTMLAMSPSTYTSITLFQHSIDMLKEAISLPGLAFQFQMGFLKQQGVHLSNFHSEPLYQLFRNNMVGGPATIFKCYAEVKVTTICSNPAKPVKKIEGYNANGFYLWVNLCLYSKAPKMAEEHRNYVNEILCHPVPHPGGQLDQLKKYPLRMQEKAPLQVVVAADDQALAQALEEMKQRATGFQPNTTRGQLSDTIGQVITATVSAAQPTVQTAAQLSSTQQEIWKSFHY